MDKGGKVIDILLVEDNPGDARLIREYLSEVKTGSYHIQAAETLDGALSALSNRDFDVVLVDLALPDSQGLDTLDRVLAQAPGNPIIVLTGLDDEETALEAVRHGAADYLFKGRIDPGLLSRAIGYAIERQRAQEELRAQEEQYRLVVDNANEAIVIAQDGFIRLYNPKAVEMSGYPEEEYVKVPFLKMIHPDDRETVKDRHEKRVRGEEAPSVYTFRILRKDGATTWAEINAVLIEWRGRPATLNFLSDITARMEAEAALRESEQRFRTIFETAQDSIFLKDREHRYTLVNPGMARLMGRPASEIVGKSDYDLFPDETARHIWEVDSRVFLGEVVEEEDVRPIQGVPRTFHFIKVPTRDHTGEIAGLCGIARDITFRKMAEERIKYQADLVKNVSDAIISTDLDFNIVTWNKAAETMYGYHRAEVVGKDVGELTNTEYQSDSPEDVLNRFFEDGKWEGEVIQKRKDGTTVNVLASVTLLRDGTGNPVGAVTINRDITERKRTEEERKKLESVIRHSQKMEAIGTLAGGIAHDFNNILAAIMGYGEMALMDAPQNSQIRADLEQIMSSSRRARDLVAQILSFSRRTERERIPVPVRAIVNECLKMLRATIPTTIDIRPRVGAETGAVLSDPTQIQQVVMNLCTNAAYAMRDTGGTLEVELSQADVDQNPAASIPGLKPGPHVKLVVSDTGTGIEPDVVEKIFEPFFTTKETGQGTGMGLAVVYGIVKGHGGVITVDSEPDFGSSFTVYLPTVKEKAAGDEIVTQKTPTGAESILFVDDEQTLARLGKRTLESLGYVVTAHTSSLEALDEFRSGPDRFDLVITDQTMPHLTGLRLAEEIIGIRPGIPVILITGYSDQATPERVERAGIKALVEKPMVRSQIARTIRDVLNPHYS